LAGPYTADTFKDTEPKSLQALGVKKVLYLDGYVTLPEVEAKGKENDGTLPESVESALKNAKASGEDSSDKKASGEESSDEKASGKESSDAKASGEDSSDEKASGAGETGAGETGAGETGAGATGAGEIKEESSGGTSDDKSTLTTSTPAPSTVNSGLPVGSPPAPSTVESGPPVEPTPLP
jgi:hypothetical protein